MEYNYWLGRSVHACAMARSATSTKARLIHLQLAGAYSVKAAVCDGPPAGREAIEPAISRAPAASLPAIASGPIPSGQGTQDAAW